MKEDDGKVERISLIGWIVGHLRVMRWMMGERFRRRWEMYRAAIH
jgi:hypothetical protein